MYGCIYACIDEHVSSYCYCIGIKIYELFLMPIYFYYFRIFIVVVMSVEKKKRTDIKKCFYFRFPYFLSVFFKPYGVKT